MEDPEVKIILTSKLQITNKSLDDNCRSEKLVFHKEMDHEVQNEKFVIQKFEVGILVVLSDSIDVLA
jgi:hypothetical protein